MLTAVDVMGFAGGFTLGIVQAGFTLIGKRELKGGFGVANCEANRHLLGHDWKTEAGDPNDWSVVDADVVFGNPPCSGFSVMSNKEFRGADSPINHCMWSFANYVARVAPLIACFESVQPAYRRPDGIALMRNLRRTVEERTGHKYTLYHVLHNAYSVGGAAIRPRYFWLISRVPFGVEIPKLIHYPLLNDVIGDLSSLELTWGKQPYKQPASTWASYRQSLNGTVDGHMHEMNPAIRRMYDLMEGIEWHPRDHLGRVAKRYYEKHGTLPLSWKATQEKLIAKDFFMGFTTPVRWDGKSPARVITGAGLQNVVHPFLNRMLTHREVARILGFPDNWLIEPLKNNTGLSQTWGKGITVDCGRWIGNWIRLALLDNPGSHQGEQIDHDEYTINVTDCYKPGKQKPIRKVIRKGKSVTDELVETTDEVEVDVTVKKKRGGGRRAGQTEKTKERDTYVMNRIPATGMDINDLTNEVNRDRPEEYEEFNTMRTYMSLHRLRKNDRAVILVPTENGRLWFKTEDAPIVEHDDETEETEESVDK